MSRINGYTEKGLKVVFWQGLLLYGVSFPVNPGAVALLGGLLLGYRPYITNGYPLLTGYE